jgi:glutamate racemase
MNKTECPIGVFDSGIGGMTVAKAVKNLLPQENMIYFGDTAHLPYGDKSTEAIQAYSIKISNFLLSQNCKTILIACNSASATSYRLLKEYVGSKASVINVIDPMVNYISERYKNKTIGLIGTKSTINSNTYKKKIDDLNQNTTLKSLATPLLAPMIEEGYSQKRKILKEVITDYLADENLQDIEALILGCTHYPLIKEEIMEFYKEKDKDKDKKTEKTIEILDSSAIVANSLKGFLEMNGLANRQQEPSYNRFYVSDYTQSFEISTKIFFGEQLQLQHYPLWE